MQDRKFRFGLINRVSGKPIPEDEPVFIFRARDHKALPVLRFYQSTCVDEHHKSAIQETIEAFEHFSASQPEQMKEPGITHDFNLTRPKPEDHVGGVGVGWRLDAARYRRLRILGCAPCDTPQLDAGTVLRFTGLDDVVDADLAAHPSRGEFVPAHPEVAEMPVAKEIERG